MSKWGDTARAILGRQDADSADLPSVDSVVSPPIPTLSMLSAVSTLSTLTNKAGNQAYPLEHTSPRGDGNSPPEWLAIFTCLQAASIPSGADARTWAAMINAAYVFLDQWGAKAAALGWTSDELFGLDVNAPLNRRDKRGAAFFLVDAEVITLTKEVIKIRKGGAEQKIYREWNAWIADPCEGVEKQHQ